MSRLVSFVVWFRPPQPPTSVDVIPRKVSSAGLLGCSCTRSVNGASFCHVERIRPVIRSSPCRSQVCKGASLIFRAMAVIMIAERMGWVICCSSHCPVSHALVVPANRIIAAVVACVRKYFIVASIARGWWCSAIKGMMARVLISRPIQASRQCELFVVIVVPRKRLSNMEVVI